MEEDPLLRFRSGFPIQDAELDRAFAAIDEILEEGAWKRWEKRSSLVT